MRTSVSCSTVWISSDGPPMARVFHSSVFPCPATATTAFGGMDTTAPARPLALRWTSVTRPLCPSGAVDDPSTPLPPIEPGSANEPVTSTVMLRRVGLGMTG